MFSYLYKFPSKVSYKFAIVALVAVVWSHRFPACEVTGTKLLADALMQYKQSAAAASAALLVRSLVLCSSSSWVVVKGMAVVSLARCSSLWRSRSSVQPTSCVVAPGCGLHGPLLQCIVYVYWWALPRRRLLCALGSDQAVFVLISDVARVMYQ